MIDEDDDHAEPSPRQRNIIYVDMDAFYASVEQRDNIRLSLLRRSYDSAYARGGLVASSTAVCSRIATGQSRKYT